MKARRWRFVGVHGGGRVAELTVFGRKPWEHNGFQLGQGSAAAGRVADCLAVPDGHSTNEAPNPALTALAFFALPPR